MSNDVGADATGAKSPLKKWGPLAVLILAVIAAWASGVHDNFSFAAIAENREAVAEFVERNLFLALLAYCVIYAASTALSLPGGALLTIFGGLIFGWFMAGTCTVISATLGATIVFLIAKSSLGEVLTRRAGPFVKKLSEGFNEDAFSYLMFLRLVPAFPFWLVNIAPALFNVRLRTYVITTFVGIIPGTFAIAFLGAGLGSIIDRQKQIFDACTRQKGADSCTFDLSLSAIITPQLIAALVALGVVALIPVIIKRWRARSRSA